MWESFFKAFAESKIPTLLVVGLFLLAGAYIVVNFNGSMVVLAIGGVMLLIGVITGLIFFADYRHKEYIDSIISHYSTALSDIGKTHSTIEGSTRETYKKAETVIGKDTDTYSIESESSTKVK